MSVRRWPSCDPTYFTERSSSATTTIPRIVALPKQRAFLVVAVIVAVVIAAVAAKSATTASGGSHSKIVLRAGPDASASDLDAAKSIMEKRVHQLAPNSGITFTVNGNSIVVDIPGSIPDAQRQAIAEATNRGRLVFRPLCGSLPPGQSDETYTAALASCGTDASAGSPGSPDASTAPDRPCGQAGAQAADAPDDQRIVATEDVDKDGRVDKCQVLGPVGVGTDAVQSAQAMIPQGSWVVDVQLKDAALDAFNTLSEHCYNSDAICPGGTTAIILDGVVVSAPRPQVPTFASTEIEISGSFDQQSAADLALLISYGALPVHLHAER
jgi:preprotein translocase subunit SecD